MSRRFTTSRAGTALLSLALLVQASGCGGGQPDPPRAAAATPKPTPAGFKRAETADYAFAVPQSWTVQTRPARSDAQQEVTEAAAPGEPGAAPFVLVGTTHDYRSGLDGLVTVNETTTRVNNPQSRQISKKDFAVPGAAGAKLIESEVRKPLPGDPPSKLATMHTFNVVALSQTRTAVNLYVRVPVGELDTAPIEQILGSLELK